jgi:large subunit ribosomal protein L1
MRDVCDDTTLSIMEAVEGGGMFSEGHSLGVADVVEAIAEEMNFQEEDLRQNVEAFIAHIQAARPASVKGAFVLGAYLSSTMSPTIRLAV